MDYMNKYKKLYLFVIRHLFMIMTLFGLLNSSAFGACPDTDIKWGTRTDDATQRYSYWYAAKGSCFPGDLMGLYYYLGYYLSGIDYDFRPLNSNEIIVGENITNAAGQMHYFHLTMRAISMALRFLLIPDHLRMKLFTWPALALAEQTTPGRSARRQITQLAIYIIPRTSSLQRVAA